MLVEFNTTVCPLAPMTVRVIGGRTNFEVVLFLGYNCQTATAATAIITIIRIATSFLLSLLFVTEVLLISSSPFYRNIIDMYLKAFRNS